MRLRTFSLMLLVLATISYGETEISASAERTVITMGEQALITIRIQSNKQLKVPIPEIPPTDLFTVMRTNQNQSQNSSISIINGQMTQINQINYMIYYYIAPKKTGQFTFPALSFTLDGTTHSTQPVLITVTKEPIANSDVRIRMSVPRKDVYVGEQLIFTFSVALKNGAPIPLSIDNFMPCFDKLEKSLAADFSVSRLFSQIPKDAPERIDGEMYHIFAVRYALFPLKPGSSTIGPIPFEYVLQQRVASRSRDPFFDDFFGGSVQQIPKSALSNTLTLTLKALPTQPANFNGAVGDFTLNASIDPKTVAQGDAATIKVALKGNTRLGNIDDLKFPSIANCEVFPPEKQNGVDTTANGLVSHRSSKYLLIPSVEGLLTIPPLTFTYFNPTLGVYKTIGTDSLNLMVTKGSGAKRIEPAYASRNQSEILERGRDIRYIKSPGSSRPQSNRPPLIVWFLFPFPLFGFFAALVYKIQKQSHAADPTKLLKRKAFVIANKKLDAHLKTKNPSHDNLVFLGFLAALLEEYITNTFSFVALGKTQDELVESLIQHGLQTNASHMLTTFFNKTDCYRFGGEILTETAQSEIIVLAKNLLLTLEQAARKAKKS